MPLFSLFGGRKSATTIAAEPGAGQSASTWERQAKTLQKQVSELQHEVERLRKENDGRRASTGSVDSPSSRGRRSSQAKLETLEETGDEAMQRYIKSQFVSSEVLEENSSTASKTALETLRRDGRVVMAGNRMNKLAADTASVRNGPVSPLPTSSPLPPVRSSHAAALVVPPRHIASSTPDSELDEVLVIKAQLEANEWEADVLRMCAILRQPMTYIVGLILRQWDVPELNVDADTFTMLLELLEGGYIGTNPYHNATHAADVAYTTHVMLKRGVQEALGVTDLQCAMCVLAAAAHDFRHPGIGANYLIAIGHDLALTYNDKSPLESFHASEFFRLMRSDPRINVLSQLETKQQSDMRKAMIGMIMATDMSVHFEFLDRFNKRFPPRGAGEAERETYSEDDQHFALAMLLHCADISNPAKPQPAYTDWTDRVLAEFYNQGDKEAAAGLAVSTFFDRSAPGVAAMQTGFIKFIVRPIFTAWTEFVPALKPMCMPYIDANDEIWKTEEGATPYIPPTQKFVHGEKEDWDWERGLWRTAA